jgi:hypothetical protein
MYATVYTHDHLHTYQTQAIGQSPNLHLNFAPAKWCQFGASNSSVVERVPGIQISPGEGEHVVFHAFDQCCASTGQTIRLLLLHVRLCVLEERRHLYVYACVYVYIYVCVCVYIYIYIY